MISFPNLMYVITKHVTHVTIPFNFRRVPFSLLSPNFEQISTPALIIKQIEASSSPSKLLAFASDFCHSFSSASKQHYENKQSAYRGIVVTWFGQPRGRLWFCCRASRPLLRPTTVTVFQKFPMHVCSVPTSLCVIFNPWQNDDGSTFCEHIP